MKILAFSFLIYSTLISSVTYAKTAILEAHCYSFYMSPIDLGNGDSGFLTTYDGLSRMPYTTSSGHVSGEVKPLSVGSTNYVVDYISTDYSGVYSYGSFSTSLPSVDSNANGVNDFLEKKQAVNSTLTFNETTHWDRYDNYTSDRLTVLFSRDQNNPLGTYTLIAVNGTDATSLGISGQWYTSSWDATVEYDEAFKRLSIRGTQPSSDGTLINVTGQSDYDYSQNKLELKSLSVSTGIDTVYSRTIFLDRNSNTYAGEMSFEDGDLDTPWSDYSQWKILITDFNDQDSNGIPDLTDTKATPQMPNTLSTDGWNWSQWPWVYNNSLNNWLFYYPVSAGVYSVYNNQDGKWYSWSNPSKTWVSSN